MNGPERDLQVASDNYGVATEKEALCASLQNSLVVCIYDAVEESGTLLHLRLAAPGQAHDPNLTDNTLSSDLALLDRALRELSAICPRAQHWQAKLVAQTEDRESSRLRYEGLQTFIRAFLEDAGVKVVSVAAHAEPKVTVRFHPAMGQVRVHSSGNLP